MINSPTRQTTPRTILVVEDEPTLATAIAQRITAEGWSARVASDGASAVQAAKQLRPDLVIMDIMLPVMDGLEATKRIVADRPVPVLILTARDAVDSRIAGLDAGADDYLIKPITLDELAARLRAVTRRVAGKPEPVWRHGDLEYQPSAHEARWKGQPVDLTFREAQLLELFLSHPSRVLTRDFLRDKLYDWDTDNEGSNTLEVHVHHLRRKIHPKIVRTLRGSGYALGQPDAES